MPEVPNFKNYVRSISLGGNPDAEKEGLPPLQMWCDPVDINQETLCTFTGSGMTFDEVQNVLAPQVFARVEQLENDPSFNENPYTKAVEELVTPQDFGFDVLFLFMYDMIVSLRSRVNALENPGSISA